MRELRSPIPLEPFSDIVHDRHRCSLDLVAKSPAMTQRLLLSKPKHLTRQITRSLPRDQVLESLNTTTILSQHMPPYPDPPSSKLEARSSLLVARSSKLEARYSARHSSSG